MQGQGSCSAFFELPRLTLDPPLVLSLAGRYNMYERGSTAVDAFYLIRDGGFATTSCAPAWAHQRRVRWSIGASVTLLTSVRRPSSFKVGHILRVSGSRCQKGLGPEASFGGPLLDLC